MELVERLGSESLVHGRVAGAGVAGSGVAGPTAVGNEMLVVKLSRPVTASGTIPLILPAGRLHVFDGDTGKRIEPIAREKPTQRLAGANAAR